jgi:hypothetical protein
MISSGSLDLSDLNPIVRTKRIDMDRKSTRQGDRRPSLTILSEFHQARRLKFAERTPKVGLGAMGKSRKRRNRLRLLVSNDPEKFAVLGGQ